jgi:hypothetical protein
MASDPVALFLADARNGEVDKNSQIMFNDEARIRTVLLWEAFRQWVENSGVHFRWMSRHKFYRALRDKGYLIKTIRGLDHFEGIGVREGGESRF